MKLLQGFFRVLRVAVPPAFGALCLWAGITIGAVQGLQEAASDIGAFAMKAAVSTTPPGLCLFGGYLVVNGLRELFGRERGVR